MIKIVSIARKDIESRECTADGCNVFASTTKRWARNVIGVNCFPRERLRCILVQLSTIRQKSRAGCAPYLRQNVLVVHQGKSGTGVLCLSGPVAIPMAHGGGELPTMKGEKELVDTATASRTSKSRPVLILREVISFLSLGSLFHPTSFFLSPRPFTPLFPPLAVGEMGEDWFYYNTRVCSMARSFFL